MSVFPTISAFAILPYFTAAYKLKANYNASNFFDNDSFIFYKGCDVFTHGLALYVSKEEAISLGLAQIMNDKVFIGVDTKSVLSTTISGEGYGRKSIRLEGVEMFDNGLVIADHLVVQTRKLHHERQRWIWNNTQPRLPIQRVWARTWCHSSRGDIWRGIQ